MEASPPGPGEEVLREKKLLKPPLPPLLKNPLHTAHSTGLVSVPLFVIHHNERCWLTYFTSSNAAAFTTKPWSPQAASATASGSSQYVQSILIGARGL